jgi:DNA replication initiation complex subunit (GINS family)
MTAATVEGLTNEEQEIYKRLDDKIKKTKEAAVASGKPAKAADPIQPIRDWYRKNMAALRQYVA